jgi:aminoglycoside 6'-N-acetyltransferase
LDQFIVATNDCALGYIQCCDPEVWPDNGLGDHQRGTRGIDQFIIDQFIGEPDMVDRGHGSAFIRVSTDRLLASGAARVITDSDSANARAIRAYEKAGFSRDRMVDTSDGPALLMVRNP